mgnify:CR=1 FL=1
MTPQGMDQKQYRRPPAFREKSGSHNLLFCLGLIAFAGLCILISPAHAGSGEYSGDLTARPDFMTAGVPGAGGDRGTMHPAELALTHPEPWDDAGIFREGV